MPIIVIEKDLNNKIQTCQAEYTHNFQGIASSKISVKLHVDTEVKPIVTTPRSIPYQERASKVIEDMI